MLTRDIIDYITTYSALGLKAKFLTVHSELFNNNFGILIRCLFWLLKRIQDFFLNFTVEEQTVSYFVGSVICWVIERRIFFLV